MATAGSKVGSAWYELNASDSKLKSALSSADRSITQTGINAEKTFSGRMSNAARAFGQAVKTAAVVGVAALGAGLALAVTRAAAFETAMLNVNSIAKLNTADFEKMKDQVIDLSRELPQSAETLAEGLYQIQSSGFAGAEGIEVLEAAAKAASAGLTTTEVAATGLTGILNAYQLEASDAASVSDIMFKTVDRGVLSFEELSSQIGTITSISAPLGVELEEVGAALAVMTRSGVDAARSATGIRAILSSLLAPSVSAKAVAKELGIEWNAGALEANGLAGMMEILMSATGGNTEQMARLLGTQEAVGAAMILGRDGASEFTAEIDLMRDAAGATDTALSYQKQGLAYNLEILKNNLDAAAITIGSALIPAIVPLVTKLSEWLAANEVLIASIATGLVSAVTTIAGILVGLVTEIVNVGVAIAGWVRANGPLLTQIRELAGGALSVIWQGIRGVGEAIIFAFSNSTVAALTATAVAIGLVTAALGLLVAHPVIAAIAAIVVSIGLLKTAWEEDWQGIRSTVIEAFPGINQALDAIYGATQNFVRGGQVALLTMILAWTELVGATQRAAEVTLGVMASIPGPFQEEAKKAHAAMMGLADGTVVEGDRIAAEIEAIGHAPLDHLPTWTLGVNGFVSALDRTVAPTGATAARLRGAVTTMMDLGTVPSTHGATAGARYAAGIGSQYANVSARASGVASGARAPLAGLASQSYAWGQSLGYNFARGLGSMYSTAYSSAAQVAGGAAAALRIRSPAKAGPLSEDAGIWGHNLGSNFAGGMQQSVTLIQQAADRMAVAAAAILRHLESIIGATTNSALGSMSGAFGGGGSVAPMMSNTERLRRLKASLAALQLTSYRGPDEPQNLPGAWTKRQSLQTQIAALEASMRPAITAAARSAANAAYKATSSMPTVWGPPRIAPAITAESRAAALAAYQGSKTQNVTINVNGARDPALVSREVTAQIRLRARSAF